MTTDPNAPAVYETLRPIQRQHLLSLLGQIETAEIRAAVEVIFFAGIHDFNGLRMVVQDDIRQSSGRVLAELAVVRQDVAEVRAATHRLDQGISVVENLAQVIVDRELLPAVKGLRDDIAALVQVVGHPPPDDPRPLLARQVDTERGLELLQRQVSRVTPIAALALLLAAALLVVVGLALPDGLGALGAAGW
jgi:hypothetical protein